MATQQQSHQDRLIRHLKKKLRVSLTGLRPTALAGRLHGPRVLINSVPKAGTHLLEGILEELPWMRNGGKKTLTLTEKNKHATERVLSKIGRGEFLNAHIGYRDWASLILAESGARMLFMIRNPRDIAVSRYRYATEIDHLHPAHESMKALATNKDRLRAAIIGIPGRMPPLAETLEDFSGWLSNANTTIVRFEDLVGSRGGGTDESQRNALELLIGAIGLSLDRKKMDCILNNINSKTSSTHRKGQIGSSSDEFDDEIDDLYTEIIHPYAVKYGYD